MFDKEKNDLLKLIAIISMFIDHIGHLLYPEIKVLRIIGRIAFPIFCYQLAMGAHYTRDINKYIKRVLIFGLISQIPYTLFLTGFGKTSSIILRANIMFTFTISLLIIKRIKDRNYTLIPLWLLIGILGSIDYGIYGILMVLAFYFFNENIYMCISVTSILTLLNGLLYSKTQIWAIIPILLIPIISKIKLNVKLPKYFFYIFYPLHLLLIWAVYITFY